MMEPEGKVDVVTSGSSLPEGAYALIEDKGGEEGMHKVKRNAEAMEDGEGNESGKVTKDGEGKKGNQENDVRRHGCVEAQEERRKEYVGMTEDRKGDSEEKTPVERAKEDGAGELGERNDAKKEEGAGGLEDMERGDVDMAEAGNAGHEETTSIEGGKEDEACEMGDGNDVEREERVEGIEEREREHVDIEEAGNEGHAEKTFLEGGTKDRRDEMGEGNHERREEAVEENNERETEDAKEKTALDGGKYAEGCKVGEENTSRKEENVEGEEWKREDVDMVEAEKEEEIARDGGEEDVEEVAEENTGEEDSEAMGEENNVTEEEESEAGESTEVNISQKKWVYGEGTRKEGYQKGEKQRESKGKESPRKLATSSVERPLREKKSVKRLVEVIDKEPYKKFVITKGRGTALKDIPNVSYKLARKKPDDLRLLHQILFGRRGKAADFKNHILQFSGFAWNENDDNQRGKAKERLDKTMKNALLDICDLFDIPVLKSTMRKEDIVVKLLEFVEAPHAATDAIIAEKDEPSSQSSKRKRVFEESALKNISRILAKGPRKKRVRREPATTQTTKNSEETDEGDEEDNSRHIESSSADEGKPYALSDSDGSENGAEETYEQADRRMKNESSTARRLMKRPTFKHHSGRKINAGSPTKKSSLKSDKKQTSTGMGKMGFSPNKKELMKRICEILKKVDFSTATFNDIIEQLADYYKMDLTPKKSTIKWMIRKELNKLACETIENNEPDEETTSKNVGGMIAAKYSKKDDGNTVGVKVFSSRKNNVGVKVFSSRKNNVDAPKQKSTGVKLSTVQAELGCGPSKEELRRMTCEILKRIDFKTGTVKDIVEELTAYFEMDLTPEKSAIKVMIQEELTRLAEEAVENEDNEDDEDGDVEGTTSKIVGRMLVKGSRKKQDRHEFAGAKTKRTEDSEMDAISGRPNNRKPYDSQEKDAHLKNGKRELPRSSKHWFASKGKLESNPKMYPVTTARVRGQILTPSKHQLEGREDVQEVFSRRRKNAHAPEKTLSSKQDKTERSSGKRPSTSKGEDASGPSEEELRRAICEILETVDFSTATFRDVINQITDSYKMDLTPKMKTIKSMIEEELRRLVVDEEEEEEEEAASKSSGKRMKV